MPFNHPISVLKAEFFRVLGHPARVRILELLREGERPVGQYQDELGLDSSGTSQHLGALRKQGLIGFFSSSSGRACPPVPELMYPFCTRPEPQGRSCERMSTPGSQPGGRRFRVRPEP